MKPYLFNAGGHYPTGVTAGDAVIKPKKQQPFSRKTDQINSRGVVV